MMSDACQNCFLHETSGQCQQYCDTRFKVVIKEPKSTTWTFENNYGKCVCLIRIDGCMISRSETRKCDYLFLVCDEHEKSAFFIELKGKNLEEAFKQILSTVEKLKGYLTGFCLYARIAITRVPNILSAGAQKREKDIAKLLQREGCSRKKLDYQKSNTSESM
ncbi:MAG: hypothetical protein HC877_23690 [Thioploca sp.]|nr:hypothetical protein [Thioploca sp.]